MSLKISSTIFLFFFFFLLNSIAIASSISVSNSIPMAEVQPASSAHANVYIIYTEQPADGPDHEAFHLRTLSNVVGSEQAAKDSLIYVYKNAATGFSAKLTPEQVSELQKQPGVIQVVKSQSIQLHSGGGAQNV